MTIPGLAGAAGLGELSTLSYLGQPFRAQVELVAQDREFSGSISPRIASPDAFRDAGLRYGPSVSGMRVTVRRPVVGAPFLEITSTRPVNEPAFSLLIETDWDSTTIRRAYSVLLEIAKFDAASAVPPAPVVPDEQHSPIVSIAAGAAKAEPRASPGGGARTQEAPPPARREPAPAVKSAANEAPLSSDTLARVRALEEKSAADRQALDGLLARATAMEKAVKGLEEGVEACKRCAVAVQEPVQAKPPAQASAPPKGEVAAKPEPPSGDSAPPKAEAAPTPEPAAPPQDQKEKVAQVAAVTAPPANRPKTGGPAVATPLPGPESSATESFGDGSTYVAVGGGVVLLGGLAYWLVRRRRSSGVTPEGIIQNLLNRDPSREDLQIKLLKVFAERGDIAAYRRVATEFKQTAGTGSKNWPTVAAMGRMLDPSNPLYEDPPAAPAESPPKAG